MIILSPNTSGSQSFKVRTRPAVSASLVTSASISLHLANEDTNQEITITPTYASYNTYDFLVVSASLYLTGSDFYTIRINQMTGSNICTELYRGEILPTTESATVRNSEPLLSYTGSSTTQVLNEYIIY